MSTGTRTCSPVPRTTVSETSMTDLAPSAFRESSPTESAPSASHPTDLPAEHLAVCSASTKHSTTAPFELAPTFTGPQSANPRRVRIISISSNKDSSLVSITDISIASIVEDQAPALEPSSVSPENVSLRSALRQPQLKSKRAKHNVHFQVSEASYPPQDQAPQNQCAPETQAVDGSRMQEPKVAALNKVPQEIKLSERQQREHRKQAMEAAACQRRLALEERMKIVRETYDRELAQKLNMNINSWQQLPELARQRREERQMRTAAAEAERRRHEIDAIAQSQKANVNASDCDDVATIKPRVHDSSIDEVANCSNPWASQSVSETLGEISARDVSVDEVETKNATAIDILDCEMVANPWAASQSISDREKATRRGQHKGTAKKFTEWWRATTMSLKNKLTVKKNKKQNKQTSDTFCAPDAVTESNTDDDNKSSTAIESVEPEREDIEEHATSLSKCLIIEAELPTASANDNDNDNECPTTIESVEPEREDIDEHATSFTPCPIIEAELPTTSASANDNECSTTTESAEPEREDIDEHTTSLSQCPTIAAELPTTSVLEVMVTTDNDYDDYEYSAVQKSFEYLAILDPKASDISIHDEQADQIEPAPSVFMSSLLISILTRSPLMRIFVIIALIDLILAGAVFGTAGWFLANWFLVQRSRDTMSTFESETGAWDCFDAHCDAFLINCLCLYAFYYVMTSEYDNWSQTPETETIAEEQNGETIPDAICVVETMTDDDGDEYFTANELFKSEEQQSNENATALITSPSIETVSVTASEKTLVFSEHSRTSIFCFGLIRRQKLPMVKVKSSPLNRKELLKGALNFRKKSRPNATASQPMSGTPLEAHSAPIRHKKLRAGLFCFGRTRREKQ